MRTLFRRLLGLGQTRAFDAAGSGRRWEAARTVDGLNAAILSGATTAARRAGWYARNNPWVAAAVDSLVGNVVGAGIKPQSTHPDRPVRERLQALWLRWTDGADAGGLADFYGLQAMAVRASLVGNVVGAGIKPQSTHPDRPVRERLQALWLRWTDGADAGGLADFYGLQAMAVRAMIEGGESFARLKIHDRRTGMLPLHLEFLDREQVPTDLHREIGGGARIRAGIEFDPAGRRVAYRVLSFRPGDPLGAPFRMDPLRIPAADCIHLFKPLAAGQLRGITWLAPVLLRLHELDQFEDAALVKAKLAALFTGFITDPDGTVGGLSGTNTSGVLTVGMEPGSLIPLPPGADIRFSTPTEHNAYAPFVKNHLRAVAAGMELPYELVSGDLEGVTYSSIRAGLIEFRRRIEQLQHNIVVHQFCRPVWERFVRLAVLSGELPARDFESNVPFGHCDEPEILPYKNSSACPIGSDLRQVTDIRTRLIPPLLKGPDNGVARLAFVVWDVHRRCSTPLAI